MTDQPNQLQRYAYPPDQVPNPQGNPPQYAYNNYIDPQLNTMFLSNNQGDESYNNNLKELEIKQETIKREIIKAPTTIKYFKQNLLPLARVKKIMRSDEDMISAEAPVLFAKACEIFIIELTHRAWLHTQEAKRRTLQKNDIASSIGNNDNFDFLIDIIPREEYNRSADYRRRLNRINHHMMSTFLPPYQMQNMQHMMHMPSFPPRQPQPPQMNMPRQGQVIPYNYGQQQNPQQLQQQMMMHPQQIQNMHNPNSQYLNQQFPQLNPNMQNMQNFQNMQNLQNMQNRQNMQRAQNLQFSEFQGNQLLRQQPKVAQQVMNQNSGNQNNENDQDDDVQNDQLFLNQ